MLGENAMGRRTSYGTELYKRKRTAEVATSTRRDKEEKSSWWICEVTPLFTGTVLGEHSLGKSHKRWDM